MSGRLQTEIDTQHGQAQAHDCTALQQQNFAASLFHQRRSQERHQHLYDTHNDGTNTGVNVAASRFENLLCEENDRIDTGELLEQHQSQRNYEAIAIRSNWEEIAQRSRATRCLNVILNGLNGGIGIAMSAPEPFEGGGCFILTILCKWRNEI